MNHPHSARTVFAMGVMLLLTSCGVPSDGSPSSVSDDDLPASLRSALTTTTAPSTAADAFAAVYLIRDDQLAPVADLAAGSDLDDVLALLQRGPTKAQARAGHRSAFTDVELIRDARVAGATATIDLDPSFADLPHTDQILALGQIVLTAVSYPGITKVRFTVDGEPTEVPTSDGTLTAAPLRRANYEALVLDS